MEGAARASHRFSLETCITSWVETRSKASEDKMKVVQTRRAVLAMVRSIEHPVLKGPFCNVPH